MHSVYGIIRSISLPALVLVISLLMTSGNAVNEGISLTKQMLVAAETVKTARFTFENTERIDKSLLTAKQHVVLNTEPFMCYVKTIAPKKGAELLYVTGQNGNQAVFEPNGMPYMQMKLDPKGWLLRQNNHHTIFELGFGYFGSVMKHYLRTEPHAFKVVGKTNWNGRSGTRVEIRFSDFGYYEYTTQPGETAETIANRLFLSKYMIIENNKAISGFESIKPGTVIKLPTHYARYIELFVDDATRLPLMQKIYDDKGLFEQYNFTDVEINPDIPAGFFSVKNLGKSS